MDRNLDPSDTRVGVINRIYDAVNARDVAASVRECLRLARLVRDPYRISEFHYELDPRGLNVARRLREDLPDLSEAQIELLYQRGGDAVLRDRQFSDADVQVLELGDKSILFISAGMFDHEIAACEDQAAVYVVPAGLTPFDTAAMHAESMAPRSRIAHRKLAIARLRDRTFSKCFDFASLVEKQLSATIASKRNISLIEEEVFAFLRDRAVEAHSQLASAAEKLLSDSSEDLSASALHIRRCIKSVADAVQPADRSNGSLSEEKYLNRLSFFIESQSVNSDSSLVLEHKMLEDLLRRLSDRASKGVHSRISAFECRQVYIGLMLYLHQVVRLAQATPGRS